MLKTVKEDENKVRQTAASGRRQTENLPTGNNPTRSPARHNTGSKHTAASLTSRVPVSSSDKHSSAVQHRDRQDNEPSVLHRNIKASKSVFEGRRQKTDEDRRSFSATDEHFLDQ